MSLPAASSFLEHTPRCLCLDIEVSRSNPHHLHEIGIYRPDLEVGERLDGRRKDWPTRLDVLTQGAAFVLGHNIVAFDQPILRALRSDLALHALPLVDTLELSPIAFPQNPYHRLVKDYKLCTTVRNDPVQDARLAFQLFQDQQAALHQRQQEQPDEMLCLHYLLAPENGKGLANLFALLRRTLRPSLAEAQAAWMRVSAGKACLTGQRHVRDNLLALPEWFKPLAYVLAWLRVAGGNSVLPPWVRRQFPKTDELIQLLRDRPCADPACTWCAEQHALPVLLPRFFSNITTFRPVPAAPDGGSLQEAIVRNGFAHCPTLAILPTGGGKSLCYQLPALARFYRTGALTVIISPLQSLMKDQVDALMQRGIICAGYLNGLLTPAERRDMLDKIRLGDVGMVFVAPEQFRSTAFVNAIRHREIAAWVFDEAHCLSKWGHEFRPDYLYVSRFIRKFQAQSPSPVFCFTATAKPDVVEDICQHFHERLGTTLARLEGGVRRENLVYEVQQVAPQEKYPRVLHLLQEALRDEGCAIVFCARQKTTEELASFIRDAGIPCDYFHGGRDAEVKRQVQESFLRGDVRVIAATNAFGMGVDKADVRLVLHLDTPGSLENYLQEAGRAGRDQQPARCILLYDESDLDVQFRLLKNARLSQQDIYAILKALRQIKRKDRGNGDDPIVTTSAEILLEIPESQQRIDPDASDADTKVRIAISWLEEARLLERHENRTSIFPGSLRIRSLGHATELLRKKLGPQGDPKPYLTILGCLLQAEDDQGVSTDDLMLATGCDSKTVQHMLRELDHWQLLSNDTEIGVTFYSEPSTLQRLELLCAQEEALLNNLREQAPDADPDQWQELNVRTLCDHMRRDTAQPNFTPETLARLLKSFATAFGDGGDNSQRALFEIRPNGQDSRRVRILRDWPTIAAISQRRRAYCKALVAEFQRRRQNNALLIVAKQGELETALQQDLELQHALSATRTGPEAQPYTLEQWERIFNASLLHLNTNEVLHLARGKAVFRSAMNIALNREESRRQFSKTDYAGLKLHYSSKIVQIHVMAEYARLAIDKTRQALRLIEDYFSLAPQAFADRYFAGRKDLLERATTEASHRRILLDLRNPEQQAIVAAPPDQNHLILAGPGAGKTRTIVHRVAWLLRETSVRAEEILVLTFNRSAAAEIHRRLWALVGADAAGVTIQTLHALAMRLTGTSYSVAQEHGESLDFDQLIPRATVLLTQADQETDAADGSGTILRDRLLAGLRYLFVDEYQDLNGDHYALISAIAGKSIRNEHDRLAIMVVGDDDQNIYAFNGTSTEYIRRFEQDYHAKRHLLIENYRSTRNIIEAANDLIAPVRDRMKTDVPIRINHARKDQPPGGPYQQLDPICHGKLHLLQLPADPALSAQHTLAEIDRLRTLDPERPYWSRFAVIARDWETLAPLATLCRLNGIPVRLLADDRTAPKLHTTREGAALLALLQNQYRRTPKHRILLRPSTLSRWFRRRYHTDVQHFIPHPQRAVLAHFIAETESAAPEADRPIHRLIEALYDFGSGIRLGQPAPHGPMALMTAHRAKGQEFDHVILLDGGKWRTANDDERRLYYVAMTRARQTLTLCQNEHSRHAFLHPLLPHALCTRREGGDPDPRLNVRFHPVSLSDVILSWPAFANQNKARQAIARLEPGDPLTLLPPSATSKNWTLCNANGQHVGKMSKNFTPPDGDIQEVRVASILHLHADRLPPLDVPSSTSFQENTPPTLEIREWELIIPEILYRPAASQKQ